MNPDIPPIGKVPYMKMVAPIFDEAEVKVVMKDVETGNVGAMLTLVLHNQLCLDRKLDIVLKLHEHQSMHDHPSTEVQEENRDDGKHAGRKASKKLQGKGG